MPLSTRATKCSEGYCPPLVSTYMCTSIQGSKNSSANKPSPGRTIQGGVKQDQETAAATQDLRIVTCKSDICYSIRYPAPVASVAYRS